MVTSNSGKIVSSKITVDPINPNVDSRRFNRITLVETGSSIALIGGKVDALGNKAYIKTRSKNVSNAIPMSYTNNTTNGVFLASSEMTGYNVWSVSLNNSMSWRSETIVDSYIEYTFNNLTNITGYSIQGDTNNTLSSPITWILSAYDEDNETWIQLDSQTNQPLGYGAVYEYSITNELFYHKYRIIFSANAGYESYVGVSKFQLFTGDTSINSNEIKVDVSEDNPLYFYKYLGIRYDNRTDSIIYKYTTPVTITNTFLNKTTMLYAMFDDLSKAFKLYYDELYTILSTYSQTDIQTKLIPIASFTTDTLGNVIDVRYTTTIRDPDDMFFYRFTKPTSAYDDNGVNPIAISTVVYSGYTAEPATNSIYIMGGTSAVVLNQKYTVLVNKWISKTNMTVGKHAFGTALFADNVVTFCGGGASGACGAVISFNTNSNTWTTKISTPNPVYCSGGDDNNDDYFYYCGGRQTSYMNSVVGLHKRYTFSTNSWTIGLTGMLTSAMLHSYVYYKDNKMYKFNGSAYSAAAQYQTLCLKETAEYNCSENTWSTKLNCLTITYSMTSEAYKDRIVNIYTDAVYNYFPESNTWTTGITLAVTSGHYDTGYYGGRILGDVFYPLNSTTTLGAYPLYDNANYTTNCWITKINSPAVGTFFGAVTDRSDVYTILGVSLGFNYKYTANLDRWLTNLSCAVQQSAVGSLKLAIVNSTIFIAAMYSPTMTILYKIYEQSYIYKHNPYSGVWCSNLLWNDKIYFKQYTADSTMIAYNIIDESYNLISNTPTITSGVLYLTCTLVNDTQYWIDGYTQIFTFSNYTETSTTRSKGLLTLNIQMGSVLDDISIYYSGNKKDYFKYDMVTDTHMYDVPKIIARYGYLTKIDNTIYDIGSSRSYCHTCK